MDDVLSRAAAFVRRVGAASDRLRLVHVLDGTPATGETAAAILIGQRPDGGFAPPWAHGYSSIDTTCFRLAQANQVGVGADRPEVTAMFRFLVARQRTDGSWEEDAVEAAGAPPWATPGDTPARLYLTANAGFSLSADRGSEAIERAVRHLLKALNDDGTLPSYLHANWLAAALFWRVGRHRAALRVLDRVSTRLADLESGGLAWLVTSLVAAGLPIDHAVLVNAGARLVHGQRADGSFPSEDGPEADVHATLEAIRALLALGVS